MSMSATRPRRRVDTLLRPRSIAVLGASDHSGVGQRVVANLESVGFAGDLYLVNPNRPVVRGRATFPSIGSLPSAPDLVISAVNGEATVEGLGEASARGCRTAVVLASGFGEAGDAGRLLERRLRGAIGQMAVMGPNCLGFVNLADRVAAYSGPLMEPTDCGSLALVSQSGALACTITGAAAERGILFSHVITTGNQIDVDFSDYVEYLAHSSDVRAIACYVEGFQDGRRLLAAMDSAVGSGKAVIVLKSGRSTVGGIAARTHTGALAGSASIQLSVWRQHGVHVAEDLEEFLALAEVYSLVSGHPGARVGIVTISGGERLLIADATEELGVPLATFAEATVDRLAGILPSYASVANPLDTTGAGVVEGDSRAHREAVEAVAGDPNVDILVACQDAKNGWSQAIGSAALFRECVTVAAESAAKAGKPLVVISPSTGTVDAQARGYLRKHGIPLLSGLGPGVAALAELVGSGDGGQLLSQALDLAPQQPAHGEGIALSGWESFSRLARHGIDAWPTRLASTEHEATEAAEAFGFPVAMKVDGPGLQHRTEIGGVRTGLTSTSDVRAAWHELTNAARAAGIPIYWVLLQPMAPSGVEIYVGGLQDEQFGPVMLTGPGGLLLEVMHDVSAGLAPLDEPAARRLIQSSRLYRLLQGVRGGRPADIDKVVQTVTALSRVVAMPDVLALDVNPLIALPDGVALVDAKLVVKADPHPERDPPTSDDANRRTDRHMRRIQP